MPPPAQPWLCWIALAGLLGAATLQAGDDQGRALIGTPVPEWQVEDWLHSPPLKLADLRGKVVLVRWWTSPGCPFCAATAPALNDLHQRYRERGLVVLGFYHHKSPVPLGAGHVAAQAKKLGLLFPVATDPGWQTLKQWWLKTSDRDFTSVTFLLDPKGLVHHIHPGGEYPLGSKDHQTLQARIESLLARP